MTSLRAKQLEVFHEAEHSSCFTIAPQSSPMHSTLEEEFNLNDKKVCSFKSFNHMQAYLIFEL